MSKLTSNIDIRPHLKLFIGAHKNASTYLQRYLAGNNNILNTFGIHFYPPYEVRQPFVKYINKLSKKADPNFPDKLEDKMQIIQQCNSFINSIRKREEIENVILSDENMIGDCGEIFESDCIYPSCSARLNTLKEFLWEPPKQIYLSVRNFYTFIPSAYCEAIRHRPYIYFKEYIDKLDIEKLSWSKVIQQIISVFPESTIVVWRYEDFKPLFNKIVELMVGAEAAYSLLPTNLEKYAYPSISHKVIEVLDLLVGVLNRLEIYKLLPKLEEMFPKAKGYKSFSPWNDKEALLGSIYSSDIDNIKKISNVHFIDNQTPLMDSQESVSPVGQDEKEDDLIEQEINGNR